MPFKLYKWLKLVMMSARIHRNAVTRLMPSSQQDFLCIVILCVVILGVDMQALKDPLLCRNTVQAINTCAKPSPTQASPAHPFEHFF